MYHLVYTSTASSLFIETDLQRLLAPWRAKNARLNVTGVLLYSEGNILQVLEGDANALHNLFATISVDPRHHNVVKLADGPVSGRTFTEWSMQLRTVDLSDFARFVQEMNLASDPARRLAPLLESFMSSEQL
ncbi:BLUF domain-containing protein [Hymenobacter sp. PAMC 26628]|uniref:BLUF domain-containing protein n=1 Tax=Hymenobacter sp. PAMC 26628 TaxID=1484118 RepID=UPI00076FF1FA|nr:BLUF domain-containing protein [Hymenobacter sp. PAMC 26628]AMJ64904.1 hypothetical protein AXW84_05300 [Hymenobacter sp. PAMC 26628]